MLGDRIPTQLVEPTAITASAVTYFTNTSASFRTQMTGITIVNTGSSQRTVILYKNGTGANNQITPDIVLPAKSGAYLDYVGKSLVFTGTQTFSAKQDAGTDVTISATGIVEQIV